MASYRENKIGGLLAQGIGTSMLQVPNIVRKPVIWLPAIISSAVLGPVGTMVAPHDQQRDGIRDGNCRAGGADHDLADHDPDRARRNGRAGEDPGDPDPPAGGMVTLAVSEFMRKKGWIQFGDMKLEL